MNTILWALRRSQSVWHHRESCYVTNDPNLAFWFNIRPTDGALRQRARMWICGRICERACCYGDHCIHIYLIFLAVAIRNQSHVSYLGVMRCYVIYDAYIYTSSKHAYRGMMWTFTTARETATTHARFLLLRLDVWCPEMNSTNTRYTVNNEAVHHLCNMAFKQSNIWHRPDILRQRTVRRIVQPLLQLTAILGLHRLFCASGGTTACHPYSRQFKNDLKMAVRLNRVWFYNRRVSHD